MIYCFWLPILYFGHCIVCLWFTAFDYPFCILVIVLSVCDLRLLITPLVFWSLYCLSVIYCFWSPLWYFGHCIVCLWFTAFEYPFGILVIVLCVCDLLLLITPLVFWSLYCLSVIYSFWLPLWYFSHCIVCLWFTAFDYPFCILVIVLSVCDLRLLITPLVFWSLYCLSVISAFDHPFGILVTVLSVCDLRLLNTLWYFGHCIVCLWFTAFDYPFGILVIVLSVCDFCFWSPLWYFGHCIVCLWFTAFEYPFGILVIVLSVCDLPLLITPLVFWSLYCLSVIYCFWLPILYFGHCIICPLICSFWLPLWYFGHCIVCLWFTAFDYPFGILVIVLSVCDLLLLITPLVFWLLYCLSVIYCF